MPITTPAFPEYPQGRMITFARACEQYCCSSEFLIFTSVHDSTYVLLAWISMIHRM